MKRSNISFSDEVLTHKKAVPQESTDSARATQDTKTAQHDITLRDKPIIDSYAQFLNYFGIDKTDFYTFGLNNT